MNELLTAVRQISGDQLPPIQTRLIGAVKTAREALRSATTADAAPAAAAPPELRDTLQTAGRQQDEVIARLESLLGDFSQWDNYRRFSRELGHVRQTQDELRQDTERTRLDYLGREFQDLDADQRVNLRRLAERQTELGRQFDKIQTRMDQMRTELDRVRSGGGRNARRRPRCWPAARPWAGPCGKPAGGSRTTNSATPHRISKRSSAVCRSCWIRWPIGECMNWKAA